MNITESVIQSRVPVSLPSGFYDGDVATQSPAGIAAQAVAQAYEKYQKAQAHLDDILLNHDPEKPMPFGAETASDDVGTALMLLENVVKKNKDDLPEDALTFYSGIIKSAQLFNVNMATIQPAFSTASEEQQEVGVAAKKDSLGFVDRVFNSVDGDMKVREAAAAKLTALSKRLAHLQTLILHATKPADGDKGGVRIEFEALETEIQSILDEFKKGEGLAYTSKLSGPNGEFEAKQWAARNFGEDAVGKSISIKLNSDTGKYEVVHEGGQIFTTNKNQTGDAGRLKAEQWAADRFGQDARKTVTENADGTWSVSLDLSTLTSMQKIFAEERIRQGSGHLSPEQHSAMNTALEGQQKAFEAGLNKSVQLTVAGRENLHAVTQALSALIENFKNMLLKLISGL